MEGNPPGVISALERWAVETIATDSTIADHARAGDCLNDTTSRARRMMLGEWETETLAAVSGVLCRHYPHLSRFEIVRFVCQVAQSESSAQGGLWLLNRARQKIEAVYASRTFMSDDPEGPVSLG